MLSKFAPRAAFAAPLRSAYTPITTTRAAFARRTVTTDAASSHADKSDVPSVHILPFQIPSHLRS